VGRTRLLWQIFPSYLLITVCSIMALTWYASRSFRDFYLDQEAIGLESRAHLLEPQISHFLIDGIATRTDSLCDLLGRRSKTRLTVILPDGQVIADSERDPETMDNHADRPEIKEAFHGAVGRSMRFSNTLQKNLMYVAIPVVSGDSTIAVLRTSTPVATIREALSVIYDDLIIGGIAATILVALGSLFISRRISLPIEEIRRGAKRFASGNLRHTLPTGGAEEMSTLADTMNQMASQLDDRIRTVVQQRNELNAVLSSMVEGVLAVDREQRLISLNQAAADLLSIDQEFAQGQNILEIIRNIELQRFITATLSSNEPVEGEIELHGDSDRYFQAHGSVLTDATGHDIGALIVINDITRVRRLERMRTEFVANVSHEIRTPITSIQGFIETLLDSDDPQTPDTERFLRIIANHAERLGSIIEDLLSLSRIEQEAESGEIHLEKTELRPILVGAIQICEGSASEKNIPVQLVCRDTILVSANQTLLEEAVTNLIDNAVKYSEFGSPIIIEAVTEDEYVVIHVRDRGSGISEEHQPRIFERFYRVDKARSRKRGGTGLGLSIVKHITQAHGGFATVESQLGRGSVFSIHLPRIDTPS